MELLARTRIVMWEGGSLWVVAATPSAGRETKRTDFHAHHAIQVVIGLGGDFRLSTAEHEVTGSVVAVAADEPHVFAAEGLFAILFVEPESRNGRAIASRVFGDQPLAALPPSWLGETPARIAALYVAPRHDEALIDIGREIVASLSQNAPADRPDHRVRRMIAKAVEQLEGPVSLADVVDEGGLSAGRLRHLFVEQTGLSFKTYLLWLRLLRALEIATTGASLTQAAHEAGFSDQAHLSRTFRRMFGVAPTALRMV